MHAKRLQPLGEDDVFSRYDSHLSGLFAPHVSAGSFNSLALPHPARDLYHSPHLALLGAPRRSSPELSRHHLVPSLFL